jgi:uncharacterized repeat protein (TIGR01451 family)
MVKRFVVSLPAVIVGYLLFATAAPAAGPAPAWRVHSFASSTSFSASNDAACIEYPPFGGGAFRGFGVPCDAYRTTVTNAGSEPTDGSPVTLVDTLPAGLSVNHVSLYRSGSTSEVGIDFGESLCTKTSALVVRCQVPFVVPADGTLEMVVFVTVEPGATSSLVHTVSASGGGAAPVSASLRNTNGAAPVFGVSAFEPSIAGLDGAADTQAGGRPYEFSTRIDLNNEYRSAPSPKELAHTSIHDVKNVIVDLPFGFLGSALAAPQCTLAQLSSAEAFAQGCPPDTQVGHILTQPTNATGVESPIYNITPERGVAAEFGFVDVNKEGHILYASVVPTPAGYVLRITSPEIPQIILADIQVTFFGNPAAKDGSGNTPVAMFTNPSDCSGVPLTTTLHVDSWQEPGRYNADGTPDFSDPNWVGASTESPPVTGCNELHFQPSLAARPETTAADSATGLEVDVKTPQSEESAGLATPPLRDGVVTLPAGLTVNPASADGLGACSEAQIALGSAAPPTCPESSKIGSVEVETPALPGVLQGSMYLARQNENPFHALLAGYIVIDDPTTGVVVKAPGNLTPDPSTGQITGSFRDLPQFPIGDLKLHFFGGQRGELATPTGCGTYTTTSDLMPWSAPDSGPDATPSDSFPINTGCATGFAPGFTAGSEDTQAGGFSPFVLSLSRQDGEQNLSGVSVTLPPGLLGKIAGIPLCPEANANAGACPEASRVGSVQAGAGVGPDPLFVGGKAYLTGPYNGGPYGLVVEIPAVAGPFDLGTVVVRQSLRIDPHTAQVTAVSDPFPTILQGIPLRVRRVDVTLDRPGFTFNPTNCTPMAVAGTVTSTGGASANVSSRFQAGGCRELAFKPSFRVSTQAATSKKQGASLDVKVGYPQGAQANIRSVAVSLPKQLPARLTTIQQACLAAVFAANPAGCPVGSNIGTATATTPVLANPVSGPAYLVSHGGAAFPDLVVMLQGEGVTLDLIGSINIRKGVTSSAFANVPDAPISAFELKLPEGPHSGLAAVVPAKAKGSLCGQKLTMPTTLTGQNGAVVKQTTKIAVTGCAKPKKAKKHTGRAQGKTKKRKG